MEDVLIQKAGLTEGEAKVYIALLELDSSTTGPLIDKSKVARSFIYNILEKLIHKGLVSYTVKNGKKFYQATSLSKIIEYIEKRKQELDKNKEEIIKILPKFELIRKSKPVTDIQVYEGFRGIQTVFEKYHDRLKKGDEALTLGVAAFQEDKYHNYWEEDHKLRAKKGIKNRMLFNKNTDIKILKHRNQFKGCEARYMDSDIKTPAWIFIYKDVTGIFMQDKKEPLAVEIVNKEIAETFKAYFEDYWKKSKRV